VSKNNTGSLPLRGILPVMKLTSSHRPTVPENIMLIKICQIGDLEYFCCFHIYNFTLDVHNK